jgi:hypothetical protein
MLHIMGWARYTIMDIADTLKQNVLILDRDDAIHGRVGGEPQVLRLRYLTCGYFNVTPSPWSRPESSHEDLSMRVNTHAHTHVFF